MLTVPVQVRDDLGVPAMVFNSETEAMSLRPGPGGSRQPDTDAFRLWEVAGTCHTGGETSQAAMAPLFEALTVVFAFGGTTGAVLAPENPNVLSYTPANRAAFVHFHRWLTAGVVPPSQPHIDFEMADPPTIRRDERSNALGVRSGSPTSQCRPASTRQFRKNAASHVIIKPQPASSPPASSS